MIILNKKQIYKMVAMNEAIEAMKTAFVQLINGEAIIPIRLSTDVPKKKCHITGDAGLFIEESILYSKNSFGELFQSSKRIAITSFIGSGF